MRSRAGIQTPTGASPCSSATSIETRNDARYPCRAEQSHRSGRSRHGTADALPAQAAVGCVHHHRAQGFRRQEADVDARRQRQLRQFPLSLHPKWAVQPFKIHRLETRRRSCGSKPTAHRSRDHHGISASFTTTRSNPLTLTLWATDDQIAGPVSRPKPGEPPITVFWSQARGPGNVTFECQPRVDKANGKATTTATFSAPGDTSFVDRSMTSRGKVAVATSAVGPMC